ncbi:MAG: hypothetical protein BAA03_15385 [Caldibacillus debilis]|nr:MAG: hypothetical protein BAA03_15385 [Caldibacillus debilis]
MPFTLNEQMNAVYQKGLETIQKYEAEILREWQKILTEFKGKRTKKWEALEETVAFLSHCLFHWKKEKPQLHVKSRPLNANPFFVTFLEDTVHNVIQEHARQSDHDYMAIHYLFSKINEEGFLQQFQQNHSLESFLDYMVASTLLPIEAIAVIGKKGERFAVEKIFAKDPAVAASTNFLEADTIFGISETLLRLFHHNEKDQYTLIPVPHDDCTLLISLPKEDASRILPFILFSLQMFKDSKKIVQLTKESQEWKDAVILFNEKIIGSRSLTEALENIAGGFVELLPFERCAIFSYSSDEQIGAGLYGWHLDTEAIRGITEDIQNLPLVHNRLKLLNNYGKKLKYIQPLYIADVKGVFPDRYVRRFQLKTVVLAPIYLSAKSQLLGAAILDQGPNKPFTVDQNTVYALIKFGQSAGEILAKYSDEISLKAKRHFSPREIEVLKLLAEGLSTFEAAVQLNLSEYTVRDYVSAIMQKMNVKNRTEAVAKAIREGLI